MKKFLNFSTILFSYVLITVLVISCGGSSGGGGGTGGSSVGDATNGNGGNGGDATDNTGGGNPPQVELNDACFLENIPDTETWAAILCYEGKLFAVVAKAETTIQQLPLLIDSVANAGVTPSRTWDLSTARQIHISYDKDYTLIVDQSSSGNIGTIAETTDHTAEFPLQNLTIASLLNDKKDALRSGSISFMPTSGSAIQVQIVPKLAVKTQEDFISMANVALAGLTSEDYKVPFALVNNLNLVAPGGEGAKFDNSVIPVAVKAFDFDGGGNTISLNSEIDAVANDKPAAIIGELQQDNEFKNFTLDVNQPISGSHYVGTILGYNEKTSNGKIHNINININSNLTVYKQQGGTSSHAGGLVGSGCFDINNVVVKTAENASIRAAAKDYGADFSAYIGGLVSYYSCTGEQSIKNSVADVTLGVYAAGDTAPNNRFYISGLASSVRNSPEIRDNIVNLKIYRDANLPANLAFEQVAGLVIEFFSLQVVTNNLVYVDFSNLGQVKSVGGLFVKVDGTAAANNIANNMLFIADGFNTGNVTEKFGAAVTNILDLGSSLNFTDNFFSSPVNDYDTNAKLASFVHYTDKDINFNNLILDNKTAAAMFKAGGQAANLQGKVNGANGGPLSTLAEAKTEDLTTLFSAGNTSWEAFSGGYPKLKVPTDFSEAKKADWDRINGLIQTGLADRANK